MINVYFDGVFIPFDLFQFPAGEMHVRFTEAIPYSVDKICIEAPQIRSSDELMVLCLLFDVCRQFNAFIKLKLGYTPYGRQDRRTSTKEPVSVKVFADMVNYVMRPNEVVIFTPHSDVFPALLNMPCKVQDLDNTFQCPIPPGATLVAPDAGAEKRVYNIAKFNGGKVICARKHRDVETGRISNVSIDLSAEDLKIPALYVVDDICDGGATFLELAGVIRGLGYPGDLHLVVTHGLFTKGKEDLLRYYSTVRGIFE